MVAKQQAAVDAMVKKAVEAEKRLMRAHEKSSHESPWRPKPKGEKGAWEHGEGEDTLKTRGENKNNGTRRINDGIKYLAKRTE